MVDIVFRTIKERVARSANCGKKGKMISNDDIPRRAYKIYSEDSDFKKDEKDDWFRTERELRGYK